MTKISRKNSESKSRNHISVMGSFEDLQAHREHVLTFYNEELRRAQAVEVRPHVLYTAGSNKLTEVMRQMVDNPECSDVTFMCEDGVRVHASRMLLVAKSPVLKKLVSNGMAKSRQSEIVLPVIPSDVFLLVLKFLYAGEVWSEDLKLSVSPDKDSLDAGSCQDHLPPQPFAFDWPFMFRVMKSARFLFLDRLEYAITIRLWADIPRHMFHTEETLGQVTQRLTILCSFMTELSDIQNPAGSEIRLLGQYLVKIMMEHDLNIVHLRNLSEEAMHFYLYNTQDHGKDVKDKTWKLSFREYIRFWQLVIWDIFSDMEIGHRYTEAITVALPEPKVAATILMKFEEQKRFSDDLPRDVSKHRQIVAEKIQKQRFWKMKQMINFVCIHPELLMEVLEPLHILPAEQLAFVYKEQLARASRRLRNSQEELRTENKCQWQHREGDKYSITIDNKFSLRGKEDSPGVLLVANAAMWSHSVCEWKIVQHLRPSAYGQPISGIFDMEVGFLSLEYGERFENACLFENKRGWGVKLVNDGARQRVRGTLFERGESKLLLAPEIGPTSQDFTVGMVLDRDKKNCILKYKPNGIDHAVHIEHLPGGLLFPAVYISCHKCSSNTSIELIRGFDLSQ